MNPCTVCVFQYSGLLLRSARHLFGCHLRVAIVYKSKPYLNPGVQSELLNDASGDHRSRISDMALGELSRPSKMVYTLWDPGVGGIAAELALKINEPCIDVPSENVAQSEV
jgi:hypothetical protein